MNECSSYRHMWKPISTRAVMWYHVPFTMLTHYPKGVADLCLYWLQCTMHMHTGIKIFSPCSYRYVRIYIYITNKAVRGCSKYDNQDENKMNTLAFVSFLLIKISQPWFIKILYHQNFAPYNTLVVDVGVGHCSTLDVFAGLGRSHLEKWCRHDLRKKVTCCWRNSAELSDQLVSNVQKHVVATVDC